MSVHTENFLKEKRQKIQAHNESLRGILVNLRNEITKIEEGIAVNEEMDCDISKLIKALQSLS